MDCYPCFTLHCETHKKNLPMRWKRASYRNYRKKFKLVWKKQFVLI